MWTDGYLKLLPPLEWLGWVTAARVHTSYIFHNWTVQ